MRMSLCRVRAGDETNPDLIPLIIRSTDEHERKLR